MHDVGGSYRLTRVLAGEKWMFCIDQGGRVENFAAVTLVRPRICSRLRLWMTRQPELNHAHYPVVYSDAALRAGHEGRRSGDFPPATSHNGRYPRVVCSCAASPCVGRHGLGLRGFSAGSREHPSRLHHA
eukprot:scaffold104817_cov24-Tisochrysis_lutea.AAC.2